MTFGPHSRHALVLPFQLVPMRFLSIPAPSTVGNSSLPLGPRSDVRPRFNGRRAVPLFSFLRLSAGFSFAVPPVELITDASNSCYPFSGSLHGTPRENFLLAKPPSYSRHRGRAEEASAFPTIRSEVRDGLVRLGNPSTSLHYPTV